VKIGWIKREEKLCVFIIELCLNLILDVGPTSDDDDNDRLGPNDVAVMRLYVDYTDHQFSGVIRRLRVNGRPVQMSSGRAQNKVEVWHCSAEEVNRFITFLKQQQHYVHI